MRKIKAVIFDIDGTLTSDNSWTAFTRDIGASVDDHLAIYRQHISSKIGLTESKKQLLSLWQATGNANKQYVERIYERWPVRDGAKELISWLTSRGVVTCLITGSVGIYAKHIADRLGVKNFYANAELHFDQSGALIGFDYITNQAARKAEQLNEFCRLHRIEPHECVVVGDSDNDIELFRRTGHGILLDHADASDELRQSAWTIAQTLPDIEKAIRDRFFSRRQSGN